MIDLTRSRSPGSCCSAAAPSCSRARLHHPDRGEGQRDSARSGRRTDPDARRSRSASTSASSSSSTSASRRAGRNSGRSREPRQRRRLSLSHLPPALRRHAPAPAGPDRPAAGSGVGRQPAAAAHHRASRPPATRPRRSPTPTCSSRRACSTGSTLPGRRTSTSHGALPDASGVAADARAAVRGAGGADAGPVHAVGHAAASGRVGRRRHLAAQVPAAQLPRLVPVHRAAANPAPSPTTATSARSTTTRAQPGLRHHARRRELGPDLRLLPAPSATGAGASGSSARRRSRSTAASPTVASSTSTSPRAATTPRSRPHSSRFWRATPLASRRSTADAPRRCSPPSSSRCSSTIPACPGRRRRSATTTRCSSRRRTTTTASPRSCTPSSP